MVWIGVDVGKRELEICVHEGESRTLRQPEELGAAVDFIAQHAMARVAMEATGDYQTPLFEALCRRKIPCSIINPTHSYAFRRSLGKLAKTDAIDAQLLARMGAALEPAPTPASSPERKRLEELVSRRSQLVEDLTAERNRAEHYNERMVVESSKRVCEMLKSEIRAFDKEIKTLVGEVAEFQSTNRVLQSMPGVGPTVAAGLLVHLPELGTVDRGEIAALAGLAPYNRDSGAKKGTRSVRGGRSPVRSLLYIAALVASRHNERFREQYARLLAKGKAKKVALVAVARKLLVALNAMVKNGQEWTHDPRPASA